MAAALLVPLFSNVKAAEAEKKSNIELIIDASGSMAGKIEGKRKIDIAKEALNTIINEIPEGTYVALRAYGHQSVESEKNCTDTELLVPMGPIDKDKMKSKVNALEPRGYTPIEYSLKEAEKDFPQTTGYKRNIILVSDGEETCNGNPCQAAKDLEAKGYDFTLDVIGFDVDTKTKQQLECMANASGGEYKDAKNAKELTESLRVITTRAFQEYTTSGNVTAGTGFENAPLVEPGTYGGDMLVDESKFFKIKLKKGQGLAAVANIKREQAQEDAWFCTVMQPTLVIYDTYRAEIAKSKEYEKFDYSDGIAGNYTSPYSINAVTDSAPRSGEYYTAISNAWVTNDCLGDVLSDGTKADERNPKAFYDVTLSVEGEGEVDIKTTANKDDASGTAESNAANTTTKEDDKISISPLTLLAIILGIVIVCGIIVGIIYWKFKKKTNPPQYPKQNNTPQQPQSPNQPNQPQQ